MGILIKRRLVREGKMTKDDELHHICGHISIKGDYNLAIMNAKVHDELHEGNGPEFFYSLIKDKWIKVGQPWTKCFGYESISSSSVDRVEAFSR